MTISTTEAKANLTYLYERYLPSPPDALSNALAIIDAAAAEGAPIEQWYGQIIARFTAEMKLYAKAFPGHPIDLSDPFTAGENMVAYGESLPSPEVVDFYYPDASAQDKAALVAQLDAGLTVADFLGGWAEVSQASPAPSAASIIVAAGGDPIVPDVADSQVNRLHEYFIAYYGRPGAPAGIEYWLDALNTSLQGDESQLVWNFGNRGQPEFVRLYDTGGDIESFVSSVYANLFNRVPKQAGIDYWTSTFTQYKNQGLDDDAIRGKMVTWIMDGARDEGSFLDRTTLDNKVFAANAFTTALDTPQELAAYRHFSALDYAREWLGNVTSDHATLASYTKTTVIDQVMIELVGVGPDALIS